MINGHRFCRDTGHVTPPELLALASMTVEARAAAIRGLLSRWMRPLHLRRHVAVLRGRTRGCAIANTWGLLAAAMLSAFALVAPTGVLTDETLATLAAFVPPLAIVFFGAHLAGVLFAWRALRRCPPRPTSKPDTRLVSAALFPPQALRLRMLVGERSFRPQHPLAYALAFAAYPERRQIAFDTVADLHWPVGEENDPPGAKEVSAWCRHLWLEVLAEPLAAAGLSLDELQAPPSPIGRAACRYCPRCGDQFASDTGRCPHGVPLRPLTNATRATTLGQ